MRRAASWQEAAVGKEQLENGETGRSSEPLSCRFKLAHFSFAGQPCSPGRTRLRWEFEFAQRETGEMKAAALSVGTASAPFRNSRLFKMAAFRLTSNSYLTPGKDSC